MENVAGPTLFLAVYRLQSGWHDLVSRNIKKMNAKTFWLAAAICVVSACKDRPGMGADTGADTINKKQGGKNIGDSSVAFAGKLDTMGVLFLQREWLSLQSDSALAATAVQRAKGQQAQALAHSMLQMYPERRRELEGIAYQLNVPLHDHPATETGRAMKPGGGFDAQFIETIKSRWMNADTSYRSAMRDDNNLLKDFASRRRKKVREQADSLEALQKR